MGSGGGDGLSSLLGSGSSATPAATQSPSMPTQQVGMLANSPTSIPLQPQTPQDLGLDPMQSQNQFGWQPLAGK